MQKTTHTQKKKTKEYTDQYLIYTRKSTDDADNQKNSIEYQVQEGLKHCQRENLPVAVVTIEGFCKKGIIEEHHSGFKQNETFKILPDGMVKQRVARPKFLMLASLLQQRRFKGVICLCWDRISRNEADDVLIKKLISIGIDFRFVQASYDKSSSGALHMDIDGMFSRHYSRVISEKVKNTATKLRAEGRCLYITPLGYLDQGSHLKPLDPERAPIVKRIFELYATGEWSYTSLAQWANQQGLTTKPARKKRTKDEKLSGVSIDTIPKMSRPVTIKSIENILTNPFYIGKNVYGNQWIDSIAHQPLIDTSLFIQVQEIKKSKTVSIHYPNRLFYIYRGLLSCAGCGRNYSPYIQKGITYYRLKCKDGCINTTRNVNVEFINSKIKKILNKIYFSKVELQEIGEKANEELDKVTARRDTELETLQRQYKKVLADYDFLSKERLTMLRTGTMSMEELRDEEVRLTILLEQLKTKIEANSESTKVMLDYILTFSDIIQNKSLYFDCAMDNEKQQFIYQVFSELKILNGELKYEAKEGYRELLHRFDCSNLQSGWADYIFSKLEEIYIAAKRAQTEFLKN